MENMNEEEKEAIEKFRYGSPQNYQAVIRKIKHDKITDVAVTRKKYIDTILNYIDKLQKELQHKQETIDKLQKENKELKEKINKVVLMIDDNYRSDWYDDYETIAGLRDDIYDLLMIKYKGVKKSQ